MQRLSMGNRFNTAAGIACQFSNEQGKNLSQHLREVRLQVYSASLSSAEKNQKARLTFNEQHVVWREENWSKVHFSDDLV